MNLIKNGTRKLQERKFKMKNEYGQIIDDGSQTLEEYKLDYADYDWMGDN